MNDIEVFKFKMQGDRYCSCGCGQKLGRPDNGNDGLPPEYSLCFTSTDNFVDDDWRCFKIECMPKVIEHLEPSVDLSEQIYENYITAQEVML